MPVSSSSWITYLIYFIAFLFALAKEKRDDVLLKILDFASLLPALGSRVKDISIDFFFPKAKNHLLPISDITPIFSRSVSWLNLFFDSGKNWLIDLSKALLKTDQSDTYALSQKIFGAIFQLLLVLLFIYADAIQLYNTFSVLFPDDMIDKYPFLGVLTPSLLISSIGITITAGFLLAEYYGKTNFFYSSKSRSKFDEILCIFIWISFVWAVINDGLISVVKITSMPIIAPILEPGIKSGIEMAAAISAQIIVVPMLLITFCLCESLSGLTLIVSLALSLLSLFWGFVHMGVIILLAIVLYGFPYIIDYFLRLLLFIIVFISLLSGLIILGIGTIIIYLLKLLQSLINLIYHPTDLLVMLIQGVFSRA
jgi:hypothetical protein